MFQSRTIQPGNLYIPIVRVKDGLDYITEAWAKGAVASFWQKNHPNPPTDMPIIMVDDCMSALQNIASSYRKEMSVKIVAVTGEKEREFHQEIGLIINPKNIDYVFTVGDLARKIAVVAAQHFPQGNVIAFESKENVISKIKSLISPTDVILIKGSRGMELEKVVSGIC